ncbi:MAG TPA: hypothetical protein VGK94_06705 [Candidatus Polarisedimenticolia bacterium]|jgi:hypothetical protein
MKQHFSDRASLLHAMTAVRDSTFHGLDLVHDEAAGTFTMTVTRPDAPDSPGSRFFRRKASYIKTMVTVRHVTGFRQYLAGEKDDIFIVDRVEVGRGGQEVAFYFRPGDRCVMDVDQIAGSVEDVGKATAAPRRPAIRNPLVAEEKAAAHRTSASRRIFGSSGKKRG